MSDEKKIAVVVQRCGKNIIAGAEVYALKLAEAIAKNNRQIEIFTSQSDDYILWNNNLPEKEYLQIEDRQILIRRFPISHSRLKIMFAIIKRINNLLYNKLNPIYNFLSPILDYIFLRTQGPWCPKLWLYLKENSDQYSLIIIKSYLYSSSYFTIQKTYKKVNILFIVTAHNEPEFNFNFVNKMINYSKFIGFVSNAEKEFCYSTKPNTKEKPFLILPPGFNEELDLNDTLQKKVQDISRKKFFLSIGRIDKNKNIDFIFKNTPQNCLVVFVGDLKMDIPKDNRFLYLGRVNEQEKKQLMQTAIALLMVSKLEAYSIVTAEAIKYKCLVLALKGCEPVEELIKHYGGHITDENNYSKVMEELWEERFIFDRSTIKSDLIVQEKSFLKNATQILNLA
ncbi:glycosyltransferase [Fluviispira multicolorata]|uniref:Glycosyltransferase n=1 Tax=Fluviispira multicolorata TaxID=2654512 RepID=A0A833N3W4_9BACT|nr:glycosyltransferase [Fluviispira multicolorata]KAB8029227.1 glycosyltransferase [Fluviispira multicolorata]